MHTHIHDVCLYVCMYTIDKKIALALINILPIMKHSYNLHSHATITRLA